MKHSRLFLLTVVIIFTLSFINHNNYSNQPAFLGGLFSKISRIFKIKSTPTVLPTVSTNAIYNKQNSSSKKTANALVPKMTSKGITESKSTLTPVISLTTSTAIPAPSNLISSPTPTLISIKAFDIKNLLVYWNFDEGSGTTIYDSSLNGINGSIWNAGSTIWQDPGKVGRALEMDGYDDYINIENQTAINLGAENQSYSISLWVKRNGNPPYEGGIISKNDGFGKYPFAITIQKNGEIAFHLYDGINLAKITSDTSITNNEWTHIVAVRNGANKRLMLYVNDEALSVAEDTTKGNLKNDDNISIGRYPFGDGSFYQDSFIIDDARIYGSALTGAEVKALYDFGNSKVSVLGFLLSLIQKIFSF